jgi:hypothetical protein
MFPNIRLMVVAILAAIAGISCGLGLFATFRVNHEPLARLAEGSPPMQLAVDNLALGSNARAGMETRLPVTGIAKMISAPVIVPTPEPAVADQAGADAAVVTELASVPQAETAEATDQSNTTNPAVAAQTEPPSVNPEVTGAAPTDDSNTATSPVVAAQAEPSSVTAEAAAPSQQEVMATAQDQTPTVPATAASTGEQTAATGAAAPVQEPALKPTTAADAKAAKTKTVKPKARVSRPAAPARRPIKVVRARRTVTTVAAQSAYPYSQPAYSLPGYSQPAYSQPSYTWTDAAAQPSQPVKRLRIKRSRPAKQTAPVAQSTPSASTAGLSGTQ